MNASQHKGEDGPSSLASGQSETITDQPTMITLPDSPETNLPASPFPQPQSAIHTNTHNHRGYARSKIFHNSAEFLGPPVLDAFLHDEGGTELAATAEGAIATGPRKAQQGHWQLFSVTLHRAHPGGFGIAISGGRDNPHGPSGDTSIVVSDVIASGPAFGLLHVGDRIVSANGACFENVDYSTAVCVMKDAQRLDMIVKRQMPPTPLGQELEQRTLKFTLSKSRKKDDFGIVLGCRYFIREITNPKLAEKDPGLKEGDTILRINGQSLEGVSLEEASRLLHRSSDKLSLVIQRDVRRGAWQVGGPHGSRWPSQTTVYERLGSLTATPRHSPTPVHHSLSNVNTETHSIAGFHSQGYNPSPHGNYSYNYPSPNVKRFSDPMTFSQPQQVLHQPHRHHYQHTGYASSPHHTQQYVARTQPPQHYSPSANNYYLTQQRAATASAALHPHRLHEITHPSQSLTPSSIMTQASAAGSPRSFVGIAPTLDNDVSCHEDCSSATEPPSSYHHHHYTANYTTQANSHGGRTDIEVVNFRKGTGSLGIRVVGGNQVGIFVSAVQEGSIAAVNGILVGDRLHGVNGRNMNGATREEAVELLIGLTDEVCLHVEHQCTEAGQPSEFARVRDEQLGDSFYIRTHFTHKEPRRSNKAELTFQPGGMCLAATKIYSCNEQSNRGGEPTCGIVPNAKSAEILAKQSRIDSSTLGRSIFKKRLLQSKWTKSLTTSSGAAVGEETGGGDYGDIPLSAYERVVLRRPAFLRPVVLFGVLADVARQLLLSNFPHRFGSPQPAMSQSSQPIEEQVVRMRSVDSIMAKQKHCVLNISLGSVERLQLAQYAPIVVMIDVDSGSRVRELRSRCGATTLSARKLMEQASKLKKHYSHLLTATLDASKEDGWFDALLHLIFHLQERRVWMPEYQPSQAIDDLLLFPMQSLEIGDGDSLKADYGVYDATTSSSQPESAKRYPTGVASPHYSQITDVLDSTQSAVASATSPRANSRLSPGHVLADPQPSSRILMPLATNAQANDVDQLLAEHYPPSASATNTSAQCHQSQRVDDTPPISVVVRPSPKSAELTAQSCTLEEEEDVQGAPKSEQQNNEAEPTYAARKRCDDLIAQLNFEAPFIDGRCDQVTEANNFFVWVCICCKAANSVAKVSADLENNNDNSEVADRLPFATTTAEFNLTKSITKNGFPASAMRVLEGEMRNEANEPAVIESACALLDWRGGCLRCPQSGVELNVPQAAIPRGKQQEVFVKVCKNENANQQPRLGNEKKEMTISPLVMCGPSGLHFSVPVELKLPHSATSELLASCGGCAEKSNGGPNFVLKSGSGSNWKNMELAKAPFKTSQDDKSFITVLVCDF